MIQLTDKAIRKIKELAAKNHKAPSLRVGVRGGGCSGLSYFWDFDDLKRESDIVEDMQGLQLLCDPKSLKYLEEAQLDYEDKNLLKAGFKFSNPKAKRSCSCGESFTFSS